MERAAARAGRWRVPPIEDPVERMRAALDEAIALTLRSTRRSASRSAARLGIDRRDGGAPPARLAAFTVGYPGRRDFDERAAAIS
jgi:hypothetical protein